MRNSENTVLAPPAGKLMSLCPYCREHTPIKPAADYAPVYAYCAVCGKRFIVERIRNGIDVMRLEDAPCASDPECRVIEMAQGDEE